MKFDSLTDALEALSGKEGDSGFLAFLASSPIRKVIKTRGVLNGRG